MQNGDETPTVTDDTKQTISEKETKHSIRRKVWRHLETQGFAMFPRPVYNRIPNFKGAADAAAKLSQLDIFKNANSVKVNPDKPQEPMRILCLEEKKTTYVPVSRFHNGYLSRLELPEEDTAFAIIKKAVSRNGMETYGKPVGIEESVSLDLVVVGSVAVSKEGYRIGKGRGYVDLEFGVMMHMKAIQPNTLVVTTVHDSQVFDTLPAELFGPHDVPIDLIVTPTQVIETQRMSQRPAGILWNLISSRRIKVMPALGQLRDIEVLAGRVTSLKEDTDVEERTYQRPRRIRRRTRSHKSHSEGEGNTTEGEEGKSGGKPRRQGRRRNSNKTIVSKEGKEDDMKPRRQRKPRPAIDFSVKISNISPNTRVRELKQALSERGVKPQLMIWKGFRGFCYLHFFKPHPEKGEGDNGDNNASSVSVSNIDSVLAALAHMTLGDTDVGNATQDEQNNGAADVKPRMLTVEPAPPRQPRPQYQQQQQQQLQTPTDEVH